MKHRRNNYKRRNGKYNKIDNNLLLTSGKPIIFVKRKYNEFRRRADENYLDRYKIFLTSGRRAACLVLLPSVVMSILFSILDISNTHVGDIRMIGILWEARIILFVLIFRILKEIFEEFY